MTNRERIVECLQAVAPRAMSNSDIVSATQVKPHQQVFQITGQLMAEGLIKGRKLGKEWLFSWQGTRDTTRPLEAIQLQPPTVPEVPGARYTPGDFERAAQIAMGSHFGTTLRPGSVPGVPKRFDLVSPDQKIVGDAKYYSLVNGIGLPPAKFSIIGEHVWLLEKTRADHQFLIFGNDRRVPLTWLARYGSLVRSCQFFFLSKEGTLQVMHGDQGGQSDDAVNPQRPFRPATS